MTISEHGGHIKGPAEVLRTNMVDVGELRDSAARGRATELAVQGKPVGLYNVAVSAILGDGKNRAFVDAVATIKGEKRGQRPLAACLPTERFVEILDPEKISESLHAKFLDARDLAARTGSLCFFRAPITEVAAETLPPSMVSRLDGVPVIQNWDATGHQPTNLLLAQMRNAGIEYPAITSMNVSGQPEIVDQHEAIQFSQEHGLPIFLTDEKTNPHVVGSYTILELNQSGLKLLRAGNIPVDMLRIVLDTPINTDGSTQAKSAIPLSIPDEEMDELKTLDPKTARIAILSALRDEPFPNLDKVLGRDQKNSST